MKRLALRFNEEDAQNFALRAVATAREETSRSAATAVAAAVSEVETCRAKKAHCELQQVRRCGARGLFRHACSCRQAFIRFIESQSDELVHQLQKWLCLFSLDVVLPYRPSRRRTGIVKFRSLPSTNLTLSTAQ